MTDQPEPKLSDLVDDALNQILMIRFLVNVGTYRGHFQVLFYLVKTKNWICKTYLSKYSMQFADEEIEKTSHTCSLRLCFYIFVQSLKQSDRDMN